jgi:hypothetical protein
VLSPGVAAGKPGFVCDLGIVLLVPVDGLVVMRSAPIRGVATSSKPLAIKPMEVSFMWSSWHSLTKEVQRMAAARVPRGDRRPQASLG